MREIDLIVTFATTGFCIGLLSGYVLFSRVADCSNHAILQMDNDIHLTPVDMSESEIILSLVSGNK